MTFHTHYHSNKSDRPVRHGGNTPIRATVSVQCSEKHKENGFRMNRNPYNGKTSKYLKCQKYPSFLENQANRKPWP